MAEEGSAEATIRDIKRKMRRKYSAEENIAILAEDWLTFSEAV